MSGMRPPVVGPEPLDIHDTLSLTNSPQSLSVCLGTACTNQASPVVRARSMWSPRGTGPQEVDSTLYIDIQHGGGTAPQHSDPLTIITSSLLARWVFGFISEDVVLVVAGTGGCVEWWGLFWNGLVPWELTPRFHCFRPVFAKPAC